MRPGSSFRQAGSAIVAILLAAMLASGCAVTTKEAFYDTAKKRYGWTDEQILVAWFYALQLHYTEVRPDGTRVVRRDAVKVEDALRAVDKILADLDFLMDYRNSELSRWLDFLGMRKAFEKAEVKWAYVRQRLNAVKIHGDFLDLLGLQAIETGIGSKTYDLRILYPKTDLGKYLSFMSPYIDAAKKSGMLQRAQTVTVVFDDLYSEKEIVDRYDASKFRWVTARYGLEIVTWKVVRQGEQPADRAGDYVEAYRLRFVEESRPCPRGKACTQEVVHRQEREELPVLRAFRSRDSAKVDFALIDLDLKGQYGYGMPDLIRTFVGVETGADIFVQVWNGDVRSLFKGRPTKRLKSLAAYSTPIRLSIVRAGTKGAEDWEMSDRGFSVPFAYKGDAVSLDVEFEPGDGKVRTVRYYRRQYNGVRKVLERWVPKPEYATVLHAEANQVDGIFVVRVEGKAEARGPVEFVGKRIASIVYQFGVSDYEIRDDDGDGKFERRRTVKWSW